MTLHSFEIKRIVVALDNITERSRTMGVKVFKLFIIMMKISARTTVHMSTNSINFMEQD